MLRVSPSVRSQRGQLGKGRWRHGHHKAAETRRGPVPSLWSHRTAQTRDRESAEFKPSSRLFLWPFQPPSAVRFPTAQRSRLPSAPAGRPLVTRALASSGREGHILFSFSALSVEVEFPCRITLTAGSTAHPDAGRPGHDLPSGVLPTGSAGATCRHAVRLGFSSASVPSGHPAPWARSARGCAPPLPSLSPTSLTDSTREPRGRYVFPATPSFSVKTPRPSRRQASG